MPEPEVAQDLSQLPPEVQQAVQQAQAAEGDEVQQEVPSVFSTTQRFLVGRIDVTPPDDDGSRVVRLISGNGGTIIELNLSPQLCEFTAAQLVAVEVIEEDAEVVEPDEVVDPPTKDGES